MMHIFKKHTHKKKDFCEFICKGYLEFCFPVFEKDWCQFFECLV